MPGKEALPVCGATLFRKQLPFSPHHPVPQNRRRRTAPLLGRPPCMRTTAGTEPKQKHTQNPLLVGLGGACYGASGTGRRHCRPEGAGRRHCRPYPVTSGGPCSACGEAHCALWELGFSKYSSYSFMIDGFSCDARSWPRPRRRSPGRAARAQVGAHLALPQRRSAGAAVHAAARAAHDLDEGVALLAGAHRVQQPGRRAGVECATATLRSKAVQVVAGLLHALQAAPSVNSSFSSF